MDWSEIFIQHPTSLSARATTYFSYKGHNTVKLLVAISPTGAIIFILKCWGGHVTDKYMTAHSGFLDHLIHGDQVLADRVQMLQLSKQQNHNSSHIKSWPCTCVQHHRSGFLVIKIFSFLPKKQNFIA